MGLKSRQAAVTAKASAKINTAKNNNLGGTASTGVMEDVTAWLIGNRYDVKAEILIFNVEVCSALYMSVALQNSAKLPTTLAAMAVDGVQSMVATSISDIDKMVENITAKAVQVLFTAEFVFLDKYVEAMVPVLYGALRSAFVATAYNMTNRQYYSQLDSITPTNLDNTILSTF
ncbi:hypothetical protein ON010_g4961 [Phytophthora cinnamomi]|nr:hypothetical protein ON010_g4961 [Phytophthora cinnamomi]